MIYLFHFQYLYIFTSCNLSLSKSIFHPSISTGSVKTILSSRHNPYH